MVLENFLVLQVLNTYEDYMFQDFICKKEFCLFLKLQQKKENLDILPLDSFKPSTYPTDDISLIEMSQDPFLAPMGWDDEDDDDDDEIVEDY